MELRDRGSGDFVRLEPTRYEFPDLVGVAYDSDWLIVSGEARVGGEAWQWAQPNLLVGEAHALAAWLDRAAAGRVEVSEARDEDGFFEPDLDFIEPHLAFSVASIGSESTRVRVFLRHESCPPSSREPDGFPSTTYSTVLDVTSSDLQSAAAALRHRLEAFPSRE